jgi:drug/metabolite transporter (DMT)-like permease
MSKDESFSSPLALRATNRTKGMLAINVAAVIFGTAALYGKLDVSPFWIVALRAGFGAATLGLLGGLNPKLGALARRSWKILTLSGVLLAAHWLTFFTSVQLAGVAVATLTFATFPLFTVIVEAAQQRSLPRPTELVVGMVILVAVALLVEPNRAEMSLTGAIAGLASGLTYALFWRASQGVDTALPATTVSLCQNGVVFLLLLPTLGFARPGPSNVVDWLSLSALGVVNTAVMLLLYSYALKHISASTCSGFVALEPVYAIGLAALLFDEPVTAWIGVSIVLIVGASFALLGLEKSAPRPEPGSLTRGQ